MGNNIDDNILCSLLAAAYTSYIALYEGDEQPLTEEQFLEKFREAELNFRSLRGI